MKSLRAGSCLRSFQRPLSPYLLRKALTSSGSGYTLPASSAPSSADIASATSYCANLLKYATLSVSEPLFESIANQCHPGNTTALHTPYSHSSPVLLTPPTSPFAPSTSKSPASQTQLRILTLPPCAFSSGAIPSTRPSPLGPRPTRLVFSSPPSSPIFENEVRLLCVSHLANLGSYAL